MLTSKPARLKLHIYLLHCNMHMSVHVKIAKCTIQNAYCTAHGIVQCTMQKGNHSTICTAQMTKRKKIAHCIKQSTLCAIHCIYCTLYSARSLYCALSIVRTMSLYNKFHIQAYPQQMRLQRRLYGICFCLFSYIHDSMQP